MHQHLILKLALFFLIAAPPLQASRIALVIGNSNYTISPLNNPINDANDVTKILKKMGFEVILKTNANRRSMIKAIQKFGRRLHNANVGLFFYAGHGLQVNGRNYLVPVDANIQSEADLNYETVDADRVIAQMELSNNGVNIIILDACRNNPYKRGLNRELTKRGLNLDLTRGLARLDPPNGTFIAYATSPGDVAEDGKGRNSPFTTSLLKVLETAPHLDIEKLFKEVSKKILEQQLSENPQNKNPQIPWRHSSLINDFCFTSCPGTDVSQLLLKCKTHLKANRLTTGRGGTAFVCYKEVLTKAPNNLEAKTGLKKIEKRYATWIKRALYRGQRYKAKRYIPKLCKVNPESPYLAKIKKRLKTSCPTSKRSLGRSIDTGKGTFHDLLADGSSAPEMVWIPANKSISRFAIGRYEVTFAEYNKFVEATNREKPDDQDWGYDKRPVINISWEEAMAYAEWLSDETGQKYSLPTEAEWKYANNIETIQKDICSYANLKDCNGYDYTAPVGEFKPNNLGIFDMSGNVSEWTCSDKHNNNKCVGEKPSNPIIILGDSWYTTQTSMSYPYELSDDYIGFRLVRH